MNLSAIRRLVELKLQVEVERNDRFAPVFTLDSSRTNTWFRLVPTTSERKES